MSNLKLKKAKQAFTQGGIMTEEIGNKVKIHLAVDPNDPLKIFDKFNELEIELVKQAGNDLEKIKQAGEFVDDVRNKTKLMLKQVGINVE